MQWIIIIHKLFIHPGVYLPIVYFYFYQRTDRDSRFNTDWVTFYCCLKKIGDERRRRCVFCISLIRDGLTNTVPVLARDREHITGLSEEDHFHFTVKMKFYVAVVLTVLFVTSIHSASPKSKGSTKGECQIAKATATILFLDGIKSFSSGFPRDLSTAKVEEVFTKGMDPHL